ncbi:hypothetical protein HY333_01575 [Candidatus Collierbacteria bacterium]|nr:hypothetical protein [Candidatus Collierbacteria bacterium]
MQQVDIEREVDGFFGFTCIANFISNAVSLGIIIAGVLMLVFLVWGGAQWLVSGGDKGKIEEAQKRITSALIGLTIVASAWAVWQIILFFFGIDLANICSRTDPIGGGRL